MSWGKRKPAPRRPHPDPARELDLLRIIGLRASITRRVKLTEQYRREISNLHAEARESRPQGAKIYFDQATVLHQRIIETEESISRTHAEIADLQSKIPPDDLAFL